MCFAIALAYASTAIAGDPKPEADEHARRGVALYKLGKYADAIVEFETAYVLYPSDTLLYNLGQSHRQLDHCKEAIDYYRRFLDGQPNSPLAAKVSELIPPLEHACEVKYKKPVDVDTGNAAASPAPAPAPTPPLVHPNLASTEPDPPAASIEAQPTIAVRSPLRIRGSMGAGVLVAGGAAVTPVGPALAITREIAHGRLEIGGQLSAAFFPGAPGTTATAVTARATLAHTLYRGEVDVAIGAGLGMVVVTNATDAMTSDTNTTGALAVPELAGFATISRALGGGWFAAANVEAAAGSSTDVQGGAIASAGLALAIGYQR